MRLDRILGSFPDRSLAGVVGFAVYVYMMPWSEFPIVPSYPHICSAMVGVPLRPLLPSLRTGGV